MLALVSLLAAGLVWSSLRYILTPPKPPAVAAEPALGPPLTNRLLFVIVDGLRYDVATDEARTPNFARSMRSHTSAEVWCGPISMTGSAIHAYGTGQSGGIEQVLANVRPRPPPFESWLARARGAGLSLALSGEPEWIAMYGASITHRHLDPVGVPMGFDFNDQTFAGVRSVRRHSPNFIIAHFVTPDHQGHKWSIPSREYALHIHDFDRRLAEMLAEFPPDWTVIVTSDHGATDTGTHGTDVPIQRRSPIYAYGPGIAPGIHDPARLEQIDVAGTMAVLLGVPPPRHSRGRVVVEWLELPTAERERIARADADRNLSYARTVLGPAPLAAAQDALTTGDRDPQRVISATRNSIRIVDAAIASNTGVASQAAWLITLATAVLAALIALTVVGRVALLVLPAATALLAIAVLLVHQVERFPGVWPNVIRFVLFTLASIGVLWGLLRPRRLADQLDRSPALLSLAIPGALVVTYPADTQPMAFLSFMVCAVFFTRNDSVLGETGGTSPDPVAARAWRARLAAVLVPGFLLWWAGTRSSDVYPTWLVKDVRAAQIAAAAAVAAWALKGLLSRSPTDRVAGGIGLLVGLGSIATYRLASPLVGRSLILALAAATLWAALSKRRALALYLGVAAFIWVCRFWEVPALVLTLVVADGVAATLATDASISERPRPSLVLLLATFLFGLLFVQRAGIQGGIDLAGIDQVTAVFGDAQTPYWVAASALVYKYALAEVLVLGAVLSRLRDPLRQAVLRALVVMYVARTLTLLVMLVVCGSSFWTAQRVLGDQPFALIAAICVAVTWVVLHRPSEGRVLGDVVADADAEAAA